MGRKADDRGKLPPFVPLLKDTMATPAWRAMSHGAKILYVALKGRYSVRTHNNGRVYISQRVASREVGSSFEQIARWFRELQHFGFIVQTKGGSLGLNGKGTAPHWRLTECGHMRDPPTRDFVQWKGEPFRDAVQPRFKKQNPVAENRNAPLRKAATPVLRKTETVAGTSVAENRNMVATEGVAESRNISRVTTPMPLNGGSRSAPSLGAVASDPPDWRAVGYPPASPSREEVIAELERRAQERGRSRRPTPGQHAGQTREQAITDGSR
jgi:hypothetical protein